MKAINESESKTVYMCGVAWQHEAGEKPQCEIFSSPEDVKHAMGCTAECGIVELKLTLVKWVEPQCLI